MTDQTREDLERVLVESARDIARKLADLNPESRASRAKLVENLREVAIAYGELRMGERPQLPVAESANLYEEDGRLRHEFEISGHVIKLGHGPGWVVMNLFAHAGNPLAAWDGTPEQITELAYAMILRAKLAAREAASLQEAERVQVDLGPLSE